LVVAAMALASLNFQLTVESLRRKEMLLKAQEDLTRAEKEVR
jgi:hypothetical protein